MIEKPIINLLSETFILNWNGIHGVSHWSRVRLNGMLLCADNGANERVVELFAFFHDSMREHEGQDPEHGYYAGELIEGLTLDFLGINQDQKSLLITACKHHTDRLSDTKDITVLTCWDADALDLGRVGIRPSVNRMNTRLGRDEEFIQWRYEESVI